MIGPTEHTILCDLKPNVPGGLKQKNNIAKMPVTARNVDDFKEGSGFSNEQG